MIAGHLFITLFQLASPMVTTIDKFHCTQIIYWYESHDYMYVKHTQKQQLQWVLNGKNWKWILEKTDICILVYKCCNGKVARSCDQPHTWVFSFLTPPTSCPFSSSDSSSATSLYLEKWLTCTQIKWVSGRHVRHILETTVYREIFEGLNFHGFRGLEFYTKIKVHKSVF